MTNKQVWQTIALDFKRAANYLYMSQEAKAEYYLSEAKSLYESQVIDKTMDKIKEFIKFDRVPEDLLLSGSLISIRV